MRLSSVSQSVATLYVDGCFGTLLAMTPLSYAVCTRARTVPPEITEMIKYRLEHGVKLMAYAYPVLPFMGDGAEPIDGAGWLYQQHDPRGRPITNKKNCTLCEHRASLANVDFQDYLAKTLSAFVNVTGIGGFAWYVSVVFLRLSAQILYLMLRPLRTGTIQTMRTGGSQHPTRNGAVGCACLRFYEQTTQTL